MNYPWLTSFEPGVSTSPSVFMLTLISLYVIFLCDSLGCGMWVKIQEPHPQPPPPSDSPVAYGGKPAYSAGSPQARTGAIIYTLIV
ncbi:hypothetical protein BMF77_00182 [Dolichospermum sp. UHCC 0315A]|jgi:hypothetical protein|nr:hypothetical protein BMF77_00182 [Dolichospermum sp. UHCC 0315A]